MIRAGLTTQVCVFFQWRSFSTTLIIYANHASYSSAMTKSPISFAIIFVALKENAKMHRTIHHRYFKGPFTHYARRYAPVSAYI